MDAEFWRGKWERGEIGFHEGRPNAFLTKHLGALALQPGARLFLPLCGKTRDIHWLLAQGYRVAGAELSALAVTQLFEELGVAPEKTQTGALLRHSTPGIDIFQGDIFELSAEALGPADAIYDRAALIALPQEIRARYAPHLVKTTNRAPQLLITLDYDQSLVPGPPFSVSEEEVRALYGGTYELSVLEHTHTPDGLKGKYPAAETAFALKRA
jgi:thiopurine S-methyltransferase